MPQFGYVNMGFGSHASKGVVYQSMAFTGAGTLKVASGGLCDILVVAGGGSGGTGHMFGVGSWTAGGGGGAGGVKVTTGITLSDNTDYTCSVGN